MPRLAVLALLIAGCSQSSSPASPVKGRIVIALTIDWEGAYLPPDSFVALDELRNRIGPAPLTHFVSAAYFTKPAADATTVASLREAIHDGDELALHLHAWRSLVQAAGIEPKLSPSFLTGTGTDRPAEPEDGDVGFDTDLDAYSVAELRTLLRKSRGLLEQTGIPISKTFRAGGYLGTPKVLQAIRDEGCRVDSSAMDHRQLDEEGTEVLADRMKAIWPTVDATTQPYAVHALGGKLIEMPIAAVADYATTTEMVAVVEAANARLQKDPTRDVFVVFAFHLETAGDYAGALGDAILNVRERKQIADVVMFTTVAEAADLAQTAEGP